MVLLCNGGQQRSLNETSSTDLSSQWMRLKPVSANSEVRVKQKPENVGFRDENVGLQRGRENAVHSHKRKQKNEALVAEIRASSKSRDLIKGRKLHADAVNRGVDSDSYVVSSLVEMYAACRNMVEAQKVFDGLTTENRSVIAWNRLIMGYVQNGEFELALEIFVGATESQSLSPNSWSFVAVFKALVRLAEKEDYRRADDDDGKKLVKVQSLKKCLELHSEAERFGCDCDIFVANTLVDAYSNCGCMANGRKVFDKMQAHDVVTWNTLILGYAENGEGEVALKLFVEMRSGRDWCCPDSRTFVAALKACTSLAAKEKEKDVNGKFLKAQTLERGMAIHTEAIRLGCCSDIFVSSSLIDVYAKCGSLADAGSVFERMTSRNVVSWTALLMGYAENGDNELVLRLFEPMQAECELNARTLLAALKACAGIAAREQGEEVEEEGKLVKMAALEKSLAIHSYAANRSWKPNLQLENSFVDVYAKCGSMVDSRRVFDEIFHRDVVSWNSLLLGYVDNGEDEKTLELFAIMRAQRLCDPDGRTFLAALKACTSLAVKEEGKEVDGKVLKMRALELGMEIHSYSRRCSCCDTDIFVANTLVDMYSKCGSMADASRVFEAMQKHTVVSWTAAILGFAENGEGEAGLELFLRMRSESPQLQDACLYVAALKACNSIALLQYGKAIHGEICRRGMESFATIESSLVDFYGKCGDMIAAQQVFDTAVTEDVVTWTALLTGFSRQGDTNRVFELFDGMQANGLRPVGVTYLALLSSCSHAGLVDRGKRFFELMKKQHRIRPEIDHYHCLVDLLGRANQLESAVEVIRSMPFAATAVTWTTLLAACKKSNDVEIAKVGFDELLSLNKEQAAAYVLMRNVYGGGDRPQEQEI